MKRNPYERTRIEASGSAMAQRNPPGVRPYRVDISRSMSAKIVLRDANFLDTCGAKAGAMSKSELVMKTF